MTLEKKKVFFVPAYFYFSMPDFEKIIRELGAEVDSFIISVPEQTDKSANYGYDKQYFRDKCLQFLDVPFSPIKTEHRCGLISKIATARMHWRNFYNIKSFLKNHKPDLVIVSSDLGHLNIRFFIEHCLLRRIPVLIFWTCDIEVPQKNVLFDFFNKLLFLSPIRFLRFGRAYIFKGNITGTFALHSGILLISEAGKQKLISHGIQKERITVVDPPNDAPVIRSKSEVIAELGISPNSKIIVFFTEFIQRIYGIDYVRSLHQELAKIFQQIATTYNVSIIIKPHPRDYQQFPDEYESLINSIFKVPYCKIVNNMRAEDLLAISDLNIAHYSKVLITSSIMGKRFLSININNDRERTFIPDKLSKSLEVKTYHDIEDKILKIINNNPLTKEIDGAIKIIAQDYTNAARKSIKIKIIQQLK